MLSRRFWIVLLAAGGVLAGVLVLPTSPALAAGAGDPGHECALDPMSAFCERWISENGPIDDPAAPVCIDGEDYVPCRSPILSDGMPGWWVGDVVVGDGAWAQLSVDGDARSIDDPVNQATRGCWGWADYNDGGLPSSPDENGHWYRLLCLGPQTFDGHVVHSMPGFNEELHAWRRTSGAPVGDPVRAAQNAHAALGIGDPVVRTAPPPGQGSVPLGMPVWLAVDEGESRWGRLHGSGCDGSLCVEIEAYVDRVEWRLGDGQTRACDRGQNRIWQPGMAFLEPGGVCHHYYDTPSRDLDGGHYQVEVIAHWHTHWRAPALGLSSGDTPLEHSYQAQATIRVDEIQVLVRR